MTPGSEVKDSPDLQASQASRVQRETPLGALLDPRDPLERRVSGMTGVPGPLAPQEPLDPLVPPPSQGPTGLTTRSTWPAPRGPPALQGTPDPPLG